MASSYSKALNGRGSGGGRGPPAKPSAKPAARTDGASARLGTETTAAPNERLLFGANVLVGYKVEVQVKSGAAYEGIFHTMKLEGKDVHVVLKYARVIKDPNAKTAAEKDALAEKPIKTLVVNSNELVQVSAKDVRLNPEDLASADFGFDTDANISRGRGGAFGRELQKWAPDEGDGQTSFLTLEEDASGWDQFAVNKAKFGVESTFDEHIYTTKIDRDNCGISEAEAARLAKEIEFGPAGTTNFHILEERGIEVDDSGIDEEERYSSVIRHGGHSHQPRVSQDVRNSRMMHQPPPPPPPTSSGGASDSSSGGSKVPAWGSAGAGVAAVAGRLQPPPPPPLGSSQPPPPPRAMGSGPQLSSSPVDIDPLRREANKVRSALVSIALPTKKSSLDHRSSPYGTPKGTKTHLESPLVGNAKMVQALDLQPGTAHVDDDTRREFLKFKANKADETRQHAKREEHLNELKSFSSSFKVSAGEGTSSAKPAAEHKLEAAAAPSQAAPGAAAGASSSADFSAAPGTSSTAPSAAPSTTEAAAEKPAEAPKKSSLNPNAKPFALNINAKEFKPSFGPKVPAGTAGTTATATAPVATAAVPAPVPVVASMSATLSGPMGPAAMMAIPMAGLPHHHQGPHPLHVHPNIPVAHAVAAAAAVASNANPGMGAAYHMLPSPASHMAPHLAGKHEHHKPGPGPHAHPDGAHHPKPHGMEHPPHGLKAMQHPSGHMEAMHVPPPHAVQGPGVPMAGAMQGAPIAMQSVSGPFMTMQGAYMAQPMMPPMMQGHQGPMVAGQVVYGMPGRPGQPVMVPVPMAGHMQGPYPGAPAYAMQPMAPGTAGGAPRPFYAPQGGFSGVPMQQHGPIPVVAGAPHMAGHMPHDGHQRMPHKGNNRGNRDKGHHREGPQHDARAGPAMHQHPYPPHHAEHQEEH